jgi:uncharacterized protein (DUF779 family)
MRVSGTERAAEVVRKMQELRPGTLTITLGTGCCESTAPFLYEDHYAGPEAEQVGAVAGVPVLAPPLLRGLYGDEEEVVIDVVDELAESLSIETELGVRLALRSPAQMAAAAACEAPAATAAPTAPTGSRVTELPEHLRGIRIR